MICNECLVFEYYLLLGSLIKEISHSSNIVTTLSGLMTKWMVSFWQTKNVHKLAQINVIICCLKTAVFSYVQPCKKSKQLRFVSNKALITNNWSQSRLEISKVTAEWFISQGALELDVNTNSFYHNFPDTWLTSIVNVTFANDKIDFDWCIQHRDWIMLSTHQPA